MFQQARTIKTSKYLFDHTCAHTHTHTTTCYSLIQVVPCILKYLLYYTAYTVDKWSSGLSGTEMYNIRWLWVNCQLEWSPLLLTLHQIHSGPFRRRREVRSACTHASSRSKENIIFTNIKSSLLTLSLRHIQYLTNCFTTRINFFPFHFYISF